MWACRTRLAAGIEDSRCGIALANVGEFTGGENRRKDLDAGTCGNRVMVPMAMSI